MALHCKLRLRGDCVFHMANHRKENSCEPDRRSHHQLHQRAWRGKLSTYLYTSIGAMGLGGLKETRQILLTWLLEEMPEGYAPAVIFDPCGGLLTVYQGTSESRLWCVSGKFTSYDRYLTFLGNEYRLTANNSKPRGTNPSVAIAPDKRLVIVYTGTADSRLWYFHRYFEGQHPDWR